MDIFFIMLLNTFFQISYGRFFAKPNGSCEADLFVMQADGKKITDPHKQSALSYHLRMELAHPLRVTVTNQGPETELLVANPVELSGRGRPLVFHDITVALKILNIGVFSVLPSSSSSSSAPCSCYLFIAYQFDSSFLIFLQLL